MFIQSYKKEKKNITPNSNTSEIKKKQPYSGKSK